MLKYGYVNTNLCDFCNMYVESPKHLFWECMITQDFWAQVNRILRDKNISVKLNLRTIAFGETDLTRKNTVANFIILNAKYYIYLNKCQKTIPRIEIFERFLQYKINIEKHIALLNDKIQHHEDKWREFNVT